MCRGRPGEVATRSRPPVYMLAAARWAGCAGRPLLRAGCVSWRSAGEGGGGGMDGETVARGGRRLEQPASWRKPPPRSPQDHMVVKYSRFLLTNPLAWYGGKLPLRICHILIPGILRTE